MVNRKEELANTILVPGILILIFLFLLIISWKFGGSVGDMLGKLIYNLLHV